MIPLILYEDDNIIVVNKPAGLLAQADSTGRTSLLGVITDYLKDKASTGEDIFCAALHRLDRPVSGVMIFAKTTVAAGRISDDIRYRNIRKFYCAVVNPAPETAADREWIELSQYMVRRRDRGYIVNEDAPGAAAVSLRYRLLSTSGQSGLVLVELITGKRHQIRVQLSSIGSPITGDRFYGSRENLEDGIIALHAHYLCFNHPMTRQAMIISAPLPPHMISFAGTAPDITDYMRDQ